MKNNLFAVLWVQAIGLNSSLIINDGFFLNIIVDAFKSSFVRFVVTHHATWVVTQGVGFALSVIR